MLVHYEVSAPGQVFYHVNFSNIAVSVSALRQTGHFHISVLSVTQKNCYHIATSPLCAQSFPSMMIILSLPALSPCFAGFHINKAFCCRSMAKHTTIEWTVEWLSLGQQPFSLPSLLSLTQEVLWVWGCITPDGRARPSGRWCPLPCLLWWQYLRGHHL